MSLTYTTYVAALQTMSATTPLDVPFSVILPDAIDYAEQRMYRELDLISTVTNDTSVTLTPANRTATIPSTFIVANGYNVLTPAGASTSTGTRVPLTAVSRDVMDNFWPSGASNNGVPQVYTQLTQWTILLGPAPDQNYVLETIGTIRPDPLSATNTTTFLTQYLPDLFLAASMIFISGYQRNFGTAMANDPAMGTSWEQQYEKLFASANVEEMRKRLGSNGWTPMSPQPLAATPR